ncbi:AEC family transporter [Oceanobacillus sp. J11TS1]|uniref:AEC family transporter n=1 Tax=Oceanobacillus sp. J11TS1 TaxID=2807191 RepID=UPI001B164DED|nr:AEC family transporter [Oceanobacillus sp. J11TS1]GIO24830.1 membrane protein [Oceanobacillus sp. J11TS1]
MLLFIEVILPIMAVFAAGFILQRIRVLDVRSVSAVCLYILSPALVFVTLYDAEFDRGFLVILIYMFVLFYAMVFINKILAKIFGWDGNKESAAILSTGFMNSGNYGLPVVLYSIGSAAAPYAIFIMVIQALQNNFFGVYYASRSTSGIRRALENVLKMPTTYAAILAFLFSLQPIAIPDYIHSTLEMVGNAAIPVMMVMLGMQLGSLTALKIDWQVVLSSVTLKMIVAPILTATFVWLVPVDPLIGTVLIIISAMPTAATTTMYAIEFDTEPELVSTITFISTVVSVVTLTILLNIIA